MKKIYKYVLLFIFATSITMATSLSTTESEYTTSETISVNIDGDLSGNQDWVGIYSPGTSNSWSNVLAWSWVNGTVSDLNIDTIKNEFGLSFGGNLEARLFFNNSYVVEASDQFYVIKPDFPALLIEDPIYREGDTPKVLVNTKLSGDKDWIGVYEKSAVSTWDNAIAWNWVSNNGTVAIDKVKKDMPAGQYEVRLFFHNSFNVEESNNFTVENSTTMHTIKEEYIPSEIVHVNIGTALSGNNDWVGIYPQNSSNSWSNVVAWSWVPNNGTVVIDNVKKDMLAGEYEARLFYNNSYALEDKATFSVKNNGNEYVYGAEGQYLDKVKINNDSDDYVVYYPEGHVENAPLVLVVGYRNTIRDEGGTPRHEGLMRYLASLGCYVIGHNKIDDTDGWTDTVKRRSYFIDAIENAKNLGVDTNRLGILGKSAGGMHAYALMEYFKGNNYGYGSEKSFIIDLIGYYALNMNRVQLEVLNIDSLILHFGGYTGYQDTWSQDPRTLLTLSHILKHDDYQTGFIPIHTVDHGYSSGYYDAFKEKNDLLEPIDAMIKYEFFNETGEYNNATDILFSQYNQTVQLTEEKTLEYINLNGGTSLLAYPDTPCKVKNEINYCNDYK